MDEPQRCPSLYNKHYVNDDMRYCDAIIRATASLITGVSIVYLTVSSCADQRKHQSSASLAFVRGNAPVTGEFPAQRASSAENVFI